MVFLTSRHISLVLMMVSSYHICNDIENMLPLTFHVEETALMKTQMWNESTFYVFK